MFVRALILLLLFLNLGVAAWWLTQPAPAPHQAAVQVPGVPLLALAEAGAGAPAAESASPPSAEVASAVESSPPAAEPPSVAVPAPASTTPPAASVQASTPSPPPAAAPPAPACIALGPFADEAAARAAVAALQPAPLQQRLRDRTPPAKGYNVLLPPASDRDAARVLAARVGQAGLDDYLVIVTGPNANGVALGRYSSEEGAQRRLAQVRAAGFGEARIEPATPAAPAWWAELELPPAQATQLKGQRCSARGG
ncbi:MAG: SPOR domain-containing protein [Pseudoxanthomonas sp.]